MPLSILVGRSVPPLDGKWAPLKSPCNAGSGSGGSSGSSGSSGSGGSSSGSGGNSGSSGSSGSSGGSGSGGQTGSGCLTESLNVRSYHVQYRVSKR